MNKERGCSDESVQQAPSEEAKWRIRPEESEEVLGHRGDVALIHSPGSDGGYHARVLIAGIAHKLNEGGHVPFSIVDGLRPRSVPGRLGAFLEECNKPDGGHATILWPNILSLANDSQVISAIGNLPEGVRLIYTWPEDVPFEEPKDMLDAVKSDTDALATALVNRKLVCHKVASPKEERLTVAGRVIHDNARVNLFTYLGYSGTTSKHPRVMRRDRFADPRNVSMRY